MDGLCPKGIQTAAAVRLKQAGVWIDLLSIKTPIRKRRGWDRYQRRSHLHTHTHIHTEQMLKVK